MSVLHITTENFQQEVIDSDKPVLLDFWAPWCGPCRMLAPILEQIAEENPNIKVGKINIDDQEALSDAFGIMSVPTLIVFRDGRPVRQASGVRPKKQILDMLAR